MLCWIIIGWNLITCTALLSPIWPIPQSVLLSGQPVSLLPAFRFVGSSSSSNRLNRSIARYTAIVQNLYDVTHSIILTHDDDFGIDSCKLSVQSSDDTLSHNTSYSYRLIIQNSTCIIDGDTIYGAMYGMESFSQLVDDTHSIPWNNVTIVDYPQYVHRGLMIDTGRRFWPVSLLQQVLSVMSFNKLNVLHLHLSDMCRFSVQSIKFPDLTSNLTGLQEGHYTHDDIRKIIAYAADRGIRVVPEFDIPGHAGGFSPLATSGDIEFCTNGDYSQMYNDPSGRTLDTLKTIVTEMSELFIDDLFHIGADETRIKGKCTLSNIQKLETDLLEFITNQLGRSVVGWEEMLFTSKVSPKTSTIIQTWSKHTPKEVVESGLRVVHSKNTHFYLNRIYQKPGIIPYTSLWLDISAGVNVSKIERVLGGEMAMWTDRYCYIKSCSDATSKKPIASSMYNRSQDVAFANSVMGMMLPRAYIGAGSFWKYNASLLPTSIEFLDIWNRTNTRMISRGISACPNSCTCDELTRCGKPYIQ